MIDRARSIRDALADWDLTKWQTAQLARDFAIAEAGRSTIPTDERYYTITDREGVVGWSAVCAEIGASPSEPFEDNVLTEFSRRSGKVITRVRGADPGPWYRVLGRETTPSIYEIRRELRASWDGWNTESADNVLEMFRMLGNEAVQL